MMKTNSIENLKSNKDHYSWWKVHFRSMKSEFLILIAGIVSNFKKVSWYKKGIAYEYISMIFIIVFLSFFSYSIYLLVGLIQ